MKFLHYNKAWGNFKKYVIMPEIEELRKSGNLHDLAEKYVMNGALFQMT